MNHGPILVAGASRSGKTLLSVMLASHPNIAISKTEPRMWAQIYGRYGDLAQPANFKRCFAAMLAQKGIQALDPDPERIRTDFWKGELTYGRLFALFQERYAGLLGKSRWGDQSARLESYADPIFAAYPTAKMIHMIRDPRDRYAGLVVRRLRIRSNQQLGKPGQIGRDVARWLQSVHLAKRNQHQYPDQYRIIRYETLVSQPQKTLDEVCTFLDEDHISLPLAMKGVRGFQDESGDSKYDGISTAYVGCFRKSMTGPEIAFIQARAKQEMAEYNYEPESVRLSLSDNLMFYGLIQPIYLFRMSLYYTVNSIRVRNPHAWRHIFHLLQKVQG